TCATLLIHKGVAITTVQKLLGHTSVKTTEIYSEVLSSTIVRDLKSIKKKKM
ncbi:tyrosine-type recombinase/integrase, partial [uncultured Bacteroides sp.]|uniref:tyrosine-type recombinase/integrase n=1 Tax=uncultured Bacteroides sp. TaxID=162156 RepID=UPI002599C523